MRTTLIVAAGAVVATVLMSWITWHSNATVTCTRAASKVSLLF